MTIVEFFGPPATGKTFFYNQIKKEKGKIQVDRQRSTHVLRTVVYQQYKSRLKKHSTQTDRHNKEPTKDLGTDVSILSSRQ